jgi:hypothetical protein
MDELDPRHGTRAGYLAGCRQHDCADANRRYCKQRRNKVHQTGPLTVPTHRAQAHLQELQKYVSLSALESAGNISRGHMTQILNGTIKRIGRHTEHAILTIPLNEITGNRWVKATGARRRLQALHALGYSFERIARECKSAKQLMATIARNDREWLTADMDRRIREVYDQLSMKLPDAATPHLQVGITKSRNRAQQLGWAPPLAWNDIDNPDEQPTGIHDPNRIQPHTAHRREHLLDLDDCAASLSEACRRLNITPDALEKWCERHDLAALYVRLRGRETAVFEYRNGATGAA